MELKHHLEQTLKRLKMPGIMNNLQLRLQEAQENRLGYLEFLSLLLGDELINREANNFQKRLKAAEFGIIKTFEGFDFNFNEEALPSSLVRDLATCHFVEQNKNLLICGPSGIGKTHVVKAIGHEMCRRGENVIFKKTGKLLQQLMDHSHNGRVERLFRKCLKMQLLILDDFAFRKFDQKESELLYALADERLGRASTVLTSNRPPGDWYGTVKVITTKGKSFRKEGSFGQSFEAQNMGGV
jgi:DNA replication protein DnaC